MSAARAILGILVSGAGLWFLVSVFHEEADVAPAQAFASSQECQACHAEAYAEWEGSSHAISWTDPAVRFLSNDFANQDCIDCHAPRPVFVTGMGERVLPRTTRRHEGVDCIACHELPGGGVAGTRTDPRAACRPEERLDLRRPVFCAGCHNQHRTIDQWTASQWPARKKDCLACHMPFRNGDPTQGRDHRFLGGNSLALLQEAVALTGGRDDDGWFVELENVGAGHAYPTDERSRASDVFWRPLPADGAAGPWRHLHRIRAPYRTEVDVESTLLEAHERRRLPLPAEAAGEAVEVALFYKRSPYWRDPEHPDPDDEATLVHRLELSP